MTYYEFLRLSEAEQADMVWYGRFYSFRQEADCTVMLYKVGEFYVEVYYHMEDNSIIKMRPFKAKRFLQPYFNIHSN